MRPEIERAGPLTSALDRLAERGARHLRRSGVRKRERTRAASLGLFDQQLQLEDRFVTADEFARLDRADGFAAAAVEDATQFLEQARQAELQRIEIRKLARRRHLKWLYGAAAVLFLIAALLWFAGREGASGSRSVLANVSEALGLSVHRAQTNKSSDRSPEHAAKSAVARDPAGGSGVPEDVPDDARDAGAKTDASAAASAGRSSAAKPSETGQSSSGASSGQAAASDGKAGSERAAASQKSAANAPEAATPAAEDKTRQSSDLAGANAAAEQNTGAQQAAGNNANQSAQSAAPQAAASEQKSQTSSAAAAQNAQQSQNASQKSGANNSGSNPGASSNASQGKGQGASKDALKKSRGVPSMILGVPTPDRVQGLPNPGLVRTIQKKVAPRQQDAAVAQAQSRGTRAAPVGPVAHPPLRTWMKDLIRDYFSSDENP